MTNSLIWYYGVILNSLTHVTSRKHEALLSWRHLRRLAEILYSLRNIARQYRTPIACQPYRPPKGSQRPPSWLHSGGLTDCITLQTVLFLSRDVKTTKFNQYSPVVVASFNLSNSRFQKPVMFRMWRHNGIVLQRRGVGTWHNGLFLTTASNVN